MTFHEFLDNAFLWREAVISASLGGALLAYVGFYIVLTRNAFVSAAISQAAGLGVVLAMLVGSGTEESYIPLIFGLASGVAASGLLALPHKSVRIGSDSILAAFVIGTSAATLLAARYLMQDFQHIQSALYGDSVVSSVEELRIIAIVVTAVLLIHWRFRDRFLIVSYDPDSARALGLKVTRWRILLGLTVGISIAMMTRAIGALPAFSFSVVAPVAALSLGLRLGQSWGVAVVVAVFSASVGYFISFVHDLPTGATIVATSLACLVVSALIGLIIRRKS